MNCKHEFCEKGWIRLDDDKLVECPDCHGDEEFNDFGTSRTVGVFAYGLLFLLLAATVLVGIVQVFSG